MAIITLLTDFGARDEYVGVLKGVILSNCPAATIVDLCHRIPPQDIVAAAHMLRASFAYFPEGSLHAAIIDPGVGTKRAILAAHYKAHFFLAPDNGLLPLVWADDAPDEVVQVDNLDLFRHPVSRTFHGRDIFAPLAAHLASGNRIQTVGKPIALSKLHNLTIQGVRYDPDTGLEGQIIGTDRFGNLITNIEIIHLDQLRRDWITADLMITVSDHSIKGLSRHYADGAAKTPIALIGSRNCLEIAVNCGNAAEIMQVSKQDAVRVRTVT
jgi:S-adenosylmethionine hydrolase